MFDIESWQFNNNYKLDEINTELQCIVTVLILIVNRLQKTFLLEAFSVSFIYVNILFCCTCYSVSCWNYGWLVGNKVTNGMFWKGCFGYETELFI